ncbi:MAG: SCO family protein [Bauldia sp.]|nr:SCO family protein [Bauldia sp.]
MNTLRTVRFVLWITVAVAAAVVAVILLRPLGIDPFGRGSGGTGIVAASIGGPFELVDQHGATVTEAALKGHASALFFGYTYCPDVCPTTLADMTLWLKDLGAAADRLKVYFVTVDPERDTRELMAAYLEAFDPRIVGLTGERPAIDKMLSEYRVYSRKVGGDEFYTMDHTASVYLLDAEAKFVGTVDYQEKPETVMAKLRKLVGA